MTNSSTPSIFRLCDLAVCSIVNTSVVCAGTAATRDEYPGGGQ